MNYSLDKSLKAAYELYYKWLKTPTDKREVIVGDPVSYFLKRLDK